MQQVTAALRNEHLFCRFAERDPRARAGEEELFSDNNAQRIHASKTILIEVYLHRSSYMHADGARIRNACVPQRADKLFVYALKRVFVCVMCVW